MVKVRKRDGSLQDFNAEKIYKAVQKAGDLSYSDINSVVQKVTKKLRKLSDISVHDIQTAIENELMHSHFYDVARSYISYRHLHDVAREKYAQLLDIVDEKLFAKNVQNQNANVDERSFGGRKGEMTNELLKDYALNYCMSKMARDNHLNNEIYIHDLDSYALGLHNCLSCPLDHLLMYGFNTRQVDIRPANSINTAMQLVAVIFQLQSLAQFGGVAATHVDWTMIPYVRKSFNKHFCDGLKYIEEADDLVIVYKEPCGANVVDISIDDNWYKKIPKVYKYAMDMTIKETEQAVEGLYHNLNSLQSRSGNQLPFSSINFGTCTSIEGRLVIRALLEGSIRGVGRLHKTSVFPCVIFQVGEGINKHKGDPNYDLFRLALTCTAKRLYPNYANIDWSVNEGYDKNDPNTFMATMGCRTYNGFDINGLGQLKDGRGNITPVTIILPTLAMETKESLSDNDDLVEKFMEYLDVKISEGIEMLVERYEWICSQDPASATFMWENNTMVGYDGKDIRSAMKHGTLALGQLGLSETLEILIGCDHTTEEGMELAKRIEKLFYDRCKAYKLEHKLNVGVYFSPAENLCYTAMNKFKKKYGVISKVSDKKYFTNSIHVPVYKKVDVFEKIDIESQLTGYSNAGCITYVELDATAKHNIDALEKIVIYAMDKDIPYFAINVPNDTCQNCGYCDEMNDTCPKCGSSDIQRLRRVTGYMTSDYKKAFNLGKQQEVEMRVKHTGVEMD